MQLLIVLAALAVASQAVPFNVSLSCFNCVMSGYIYCVEGAENFQVPKGGLPPIGQCCRNVSSCPWVKRPDQWNCSSNYNDQLASLRVCPYKQDQCGARQTFNLTKGAKATTAKLSIGAGEVCLLQTQTACGVPGFKAVGAGLSLYSIGYDAADGVSTGLQYPWDEAILNQSSRRMSYYATPFQRFSIDNGSVVAGLGQDSVLGVT